jgi:hypothetical protein
MIRPSSIADSPGRPGSNAGSAMGENSVNMASVPSLGLSHHARLAELHLRRTVVPEVHSNRINTYNPLGK